MSRTPRHITATEFQREVGKIVHDVTAHQQTVIVTVHGRTEVVLLSTDEYDELLAAREALKMATRLQGLEEIVQ